MPDSLERSAVVGAVAIAPDRATADAWRLALAAEGEPAQVLRSRRGWAVLVPRSRAAQATSVIEAYERENPAAPPPDSPRAALRVPALAPVAVAGALVVLHGLLVVTGQRGVWLASGSAASGSMLAGQYQRAVTALTLHADLGHALSNALFLTLFGTLVVADLGPGWGMLLVIGAGALGNLLNAVLQAPVHDGIGASTAVFGAVGVLAGRAAWSEVRPASRWRTWAPIAAGLALLALLGTGENTDVLAHLMGFIAGLSLGLGSRGARLPIGGRAGQAAAGVVAVLLVAAAWSRAL